MNKENSQIIYGVIYARYSSHNQKDVSIEQQVSACKAYAEKQNIIITEIYADRAISGKTDNRPQFQKMMRDSAKGGFSVVIAWKSNRIGRNMVQALVNEARLQDNGVRCLYTEEDFDDSAAGRFALRSMMNVNQFYVENMAEDVKRGMSDNASHCMANGMLPYGYKSVDKIPVIDETTSPVVIEIFERVAAGDSLADIARSLNIRGIKTRLGNNWNKNSFHRLLKNERYRGIYIFDDVRIEGGIPRLISDELFFKAQEALKVKGTKHRNSAENFLLTGKLFCGLCGSPMVGVSGTSKTGKSHFYYSCYKNRVEKSCDKKAVRKDQIEQAVAQAIRDFALKDDVIDWIADMVEKNQEKQLSESDLALHQEELDQNKKAIANIMKAMEMGIITETTKSRLLELENEQAEIRRRITLDQADIIVVPRDTLIAGLKVFRDGNFDDDEFLKSLFNTFLVAVYVYEDKIKIVFSFTGNKNSIEIDYKEIGAECSYNVSDASPLENCKNFVCFGNIFVLTVQLR